MASALQKTVRIERGTIWVLGGLATASFVVAAILGSGCSSTQFHEEGPGQPDSRTYGAVPAGLVGVCKRPFSMQPEIVSDVMWEHAEECRSDTPRDYLRLGYGNLNKEPDKARAKHKRIMQALKDGEEDNIAVLNVLRAVRDEGMDDPELKDRVSRESARPEACDFSYLLNVMHDQALKLRPGSDPCAVYAYDQSDRQEICLFDTEVEQAVWLSGAWACMTRTGVVGKGESCHKLCAFDDYCSRQVSCAQPDIDLALCALGVCLPEADAFAE
ncbi:MAG: hypothetical protein HOW73_01245 [Polyangiaceae bacterium]|nr:hypothetical protein [Polyangiaceae bacterium]